MDAEQKFTDFGGWLVKGSDGWLAMLEKLTAEGHALDGKSLGQLKTAAIRLREVITAQDELTA